MLNSATVSGYVKVMLAVATGHFITVSVQGGLATKKIRKSMEFLAWGQL